MEPIPEAMDDAAIPALSPALTVQQGGWGAASPHERGASVTTEPRKEGVVPAAVTSSFAQVERSVGPPPAPHGPPHFRPPRPPQGGEAP